MYAKASQFVAASALLVLVACASPLKDWNPNDYTVKSGDTLYSIAWRYEIDPNDLVRWNKLQSATLIYPGQRLHTRQPENDQAARQSAPIKPVPVPVTRNRQSITVKKNDTLYGLAKKHGVSTRQLIAANNLKKPYRIYPGQTLKLNVVRQVAQQTKPVTPEAKHNWPGHVSWHWPLTGKVIDRFNRSKLDSRGINIASRAGKPVKAAAAGKVVYSGNGLIIYGNLVIIKHNDTYLSAYANNRKLLVKEGQQVKQGQTIAEVGTASEKPPHLHFEIRKRGKPVDPLHYLPSS